MTIKLHINQCDHLTRTFISELTNHAQVELKRVNYDPEKGLAEIPLVLYPIVGGRSLLKVGEYKRNYDKPIQSRIIIKNIKDAEITKSALCEDIEKITLLFGFTIEDNSVYFGSVEEATGETCYGVTFFGDNLILELEDIEENKITEQGKQGDWR